MQMSSENRRAAQCVWWWMRPISFSVDLFSAYDCATGNAMSCGLREHHSKSYGIALANGQSVTQRKSARDVKQNAWDGHRDSSVKIKEKKKCSALRTTHVVMTHIAYYKTKLCRWHSNRNSPRRNRIENKTRNVRSKMHFHFGLK